MQASMNEHTRCHPINRSEGSEKSKGNNNAKLILGLTAAAVVTAAAVAAVAGALFLILSPVIVPILAVKVTILSVALFVAVGGALTTILITAHLVQSAKLRRERQQKEVAQPFFDFDQNVMKIRGARDGALEGWSREIELDSMENGPVKAQTEKDEAGVEGMEQELEVAREEIKTLKAQKEEAEEKFAQLSDSIKVKELEKGELEQTLKKLESELVEKEGKIDDLEDSVNELEGENKELQNKANGGNVEGLGEELQRLHQEIHVVTEQKKQAVTISQTYQNLYREILKEKDDLKQQLEATQQRVEVNPPFTPYLPDLNYPENGDHLGNK